MSNKYTIGIDIGGTNTIFSIVDKSGNPIESGRIKTTQEKSVDGFIELLYNSLYPLINKVGGSAMIAGMGVGVPNVNYYSGIVEFAPNLPWEDNIPFARLLRERFGIPVILTNDANAAAIGEMIYGVTRDVKDFVMITLGTGIGSCLVINGKVVYGQDGHAGELGHTTYCRNNGRLCACGRYGCFEAYASATGIVKTICELLTNTTRPSLLRKYYPDEITAKRIHEAALEEDAVALEAYEFTGRVMGEAFADFVTFSNPEKIVLFGGLSHSGDLIRIPAQRHMEANMLPRYRGRVQIVLSELMDKNAAVLGSAVLAWEAKDWKPTQ